MTHHFEAISNGMGGPSMYMMVLAGEHKIPATLSITADTGWENDCLLSTGDRVTAQDFYNDVIVPVGVEFGIETAFVRAQDSRGKPLVGLGERMRKGVIPGVPTFGSNGDRLKQGCIEKYEEQMMSIDTANFICAIGHNIAVVLDGDEWVKQEIHDLSHHLDDLEIEYPEKFGLYSWTGTVEIADTIPSEPVYKGKYTLLSDWTPFYYPTGRKD